MSLARTKGVVLNGVAGLVVDIEAYLSQGLPTMTIVGLPDTAVGEARDRVKAAVANSELAWPSERRITIGLSPASEHKRGASLDLAIAIAILSAFGQTPRTQDCVILGELGLDGSVREVRGVLVAAIAARKAGISTLYVPATQVSQASLIPDLEVIGIRSLTHMCAVLAGTEVGAADVVSRVYQPQLPLDMIDVRGQSQARLATEIAAAGGHHLCFIGTPGVGKTMLAERLPGLLPDLNDDLAVEVTSIHSAAGREHNELIRVPPFESPHHTSTMVAMVGGGNHVVRLGAATLAHGGVLCLDEAAEFDRAVLDALRQPLESGQVTIARAGFVTTLPANFQLVLAANPCPCGQFVGTGVNCTCSSQTRRRYLSRISGPLMDRVDLRVCLQRPTLVELDPLNGEPETSQQIRSRVHNARELAQQRLADTPWKMNASVPGSYFRKHLPLPSPTQRYLIRCAPHLSARGFDRLTRVAWTICDLRDAGQPEIQDVELALEFRETPELNMASA